MLCQAQYKSMGTPTQPNSVSKMNFMKANLWREKTELLNLRLFKLARANVLL